VQLDTQPSIVSFAQPTASTFSQAEAQSTSSEQWSADSASRPSVSHPRIFGRFMLPNMSTPPSARGKPREVGKRMTPRVSAS